MNALKGKLASRKFWLSVVAFATAVGALIGWDNGTTERVVALVSAVGALVVYVFTEGVIDTVKANTGAGKAHEDNAPPQ
jgi:uncharacterized membrane protein